MTERETLDKILELLKRRSVQVGIAAVLTVVVLFGAVYAKFNSIRHEGVDRETALTAQYLSNQNELSAFISTFYEQVGIADRSAEQIDEILTDAVTGRYDGALEAATPNESNDLISAIVEAYPDLSGVSNAYAVILDTVSAGREAYKNDQDRLLDLLRSYDKWRNEGILSSFLIDLSGFPSSNLRAQIGQSSVTGERALDQMYRIVLTSQAAEAYETGELDPLELPPTDG